MSQTNTNGSSNGGSAMADAFAAAFAKAVQQQQSASPPAVATTAAPQPATAASNGTSSTTASASAPTVASSSSSAATANTDGTVDPQLLLALDTQLFGPSTNCNDGDRTRWQQQGFLFSDQPRTLFGLTQTAGGPCGVLAPIQAWILQRLLFGGVVAVNMNSDVPVAPTRAEQDEALVWALTHVLTRCVADAKQQTGFKIVSGSSHDSLRMYHLPTPDAVHAFFMQHLDQLHGPLGVLAFVYSALLTRGLETVKADMDDPSSFLVGQFGHSAQELVNLMMIGRAVTNVFDGSKVLGDASDPTAFRLKGIPGPEPNEIGFLTLLEALRYCTVGEYYKSPRYPIWVVGSSNHYTVVFSLDRRVGQLTKKQLKQRAARTAFDVLDPENNGFVPVASLPALIEKLGGLGALPSNTTKEEFQRRLDPDNLGLILYERLLTVLEQMEKLQAMTRAQASMPNTPYNCSACTYSNVATAAQCEICGTPRPAPVAAAPVAEEREEIQNFTLYHFNGIEIRAASGEVKSHCECHRVAISVVEGGLPPQVQGDAISETQGLKDILLTRWPSAIIDVEGEAKIS